jgi:broad specificity phosphatase PhoE/predicted kinase
MSDPIIPSNPIQLSALNKAISSMTTATTTSATSTTSSSPQQQQQPPATAALNSQPPQQPPSKQHDYYSKGSAELATENALTLAKIRHRLLLTKRSERLVLVLVGLPGRGKSFIARKLQNFVTWRGSECKVFNVGKYRRKVAATTDNDNNNNGGGSGSSNNNNCDADFFDSSNVQAAKMRQMAAQLALDDMLDWLDHGDSSVEGRVGGEGGGSGGQQQQQQQQQKKDRVAIFDATNSTKERRDWVLRECTSNTNKRTGVVFVESICDDKDLLHANFLTKVQTSPDYKDMDSQSAMEDLLSRVKKYEEAYETIEDDTLSYIKIYNLSSKMLVNHIYGRMAKSIVPALMAWNIGTRPVFICRAGQTMNEQERALTGTYMSRSENLGRHGRAFRDSLFSFMRVECLDFMKRREGATFRPDLNTGTSMNGVMNQSMSRSFSFDGLSAFDDELEHHEQLKRPIDNTQQHHHHQEEYVGTDGVTPLPFPCHIMSSTMPRARQTVDWNNVPYPVEMTSNLNPLDKGDFTGQELEDIALAHPDWYAELVADPFYTRFPGGECYGDLTSRLESIVVDIEQQVGPVLVVSHVSVLQVLVAYFRNTPVEHCTSIALPLNTVLKFTPAKGGGWQESQHRILTSPSTSQCDMQSYDALSVSPYSTPMIRTPVMSQLFCQDSKVGDSDSPPEVISPLGDQPPIWGDHLYSRRSSRDEGAKQRLNNEAKEKFALPQLNHMSK